MKTRDELESLYKKAVAANDLRLAFDILSLMVQMDRDFGAPPAAK